MNAYRTQEGRWIFDLGQNFAGKVRLTAYGPAGSEIVLRYCEDLTGDGQHVEQKHISGFVRTGEFQTDKYTKERRAGGMDAAVRISRLPLCGGRGAAGRAAGTVHHGPCDAHVFRAHRTF